MSKSYLTVAGETEIRFEIKRSEFIATIAHVEDGESAEAFVKAVRKRFTDATHNCYAYISDERGNETRFSDDGEPGGTAGQPMLEVLKKRGLMRTAVVVTRYFGGIKLGAGGLVRAYSGTAAEALDGADIREYTPCRKVRVAVGYELFDAFRRFFSREGKEAEDLSYAEKIAASVSVPSEEAAAFLLRLNDFLAGRAEAEEGEEYLAPLPLPHGERK